MEIYHINDYLDNIPTLKDKITLCLGNFDGLHLGHHKLIIEAKKISNKIVLITFDNLNKHDGVLTSIDDRIRILKSYHIDYLFIITFSSYLKSMDYISFKEKFIDKINPLNIIAGVDFKFGKSQLGDLNYLSKYYNVKPIELLYLNDKKVSTSLIIDLLKSGEITKVNQLLNRPYEIKGRVIEGFKLGRTINYPTANIENKDNYIVPKFGVYKSIIYVRGIPHLSITNIGIHPTVNKLNKPSFETHILNFNEDIYGELVYLDLLEFIRPEMKFNSKEELKNQINKDKNIVIESNE